MYGEIMGGPQYSIHSAMHLPATISILLFCLAFVFTRTMYGAASNKSAGDVMSDMNEITFPANTTPSSKLLSDLTPPVTPDNTPMSIGNSPTFKNQTLFSLVVQDVKIKQVGILVHIQP